MPGLLTANEFVEFFLDDYHSPTTSDFVEKMPSCRQTVSYLEQGLDFDREGLIKMKKAVKSIHNNGIEQVESEQSLSKSLEKLGANAMSKDSEPDIGAAFIKFSVVTKELSSLMRALMQNLNNIVLYPVDNILKGELKGVKGDLKKPFERAWQDYEAKILKIEKEKKQMAKEAGLIRTEISSAEIAEEMDKERKAFQLQMCEYLLKVNDIKTKKGVELLQHLVHYYHAQTSYFQDGLDHLKHFQDYITELSNKLVTIKSSQDEERKQLIEIKNLLNNGENGLNANTNPSNGVLGAAAGVIGASSSGTATNGAHLDATNSNSSSKKEKSVYNLHQLQGNKHYGYCKSGYLLKKSEGKMKIKNWQKRKCEISGFNLESSNPSSFLSIYHSDENKTPVKINLLTCQVKQMPDDKCSFDLISYSRTYHFQADSELDAESWISVILNCKEAILKKEFDNNKSTKNHLVNSEDYVLTQTLNELRKNIITSVRKLAGNQNCVDCSSNKDITWLSTNYGCLVCIECSGIHRELGVHVSRIHSLTLDNIGISLLLLAKSMSNNAFNAVYEANLDASEKINAQSSMEERCLFIKSKYVKRKFIKHLSAGDAQILKTNLEHAILAKNLYQVLQCYAENSQCVNWVLPSFADSGDTALHRAIAQEDTNASLHLVDFLIQNSPNINQPNADGNTPVHLAVLKNRSEALKLLLRSSANVNLVNKADRTPMQLAKELNRTYLVELLEQSVKNKKSLVFENLNVDWNLQIEENSTDFSDEDPNEEKMSAKEYFDWLLNSRNSLSAAKNRAHADTNSIISNDTIAFKNNLDNQSRSSSVLDQFHSAQHNMIISKLNNGQQQCPPPLPPHKNAVKQALQNNNNQNVANNNHLSKKEQFLRNSNKTTSMHSRTISDLGLKAPMNGHRKNASIDLSNMNSFIASNNNNQTGQKNLNARRRTYIDSCTQLNYSDVHHPHSLKRPAVPPPLVPINHHNQTNRHHHSNSQTNLLSSNPFINNNIVKQTDETGKLIRRKQSIYIENRHHLSNGQSFESLPSSDDLNNSNNSGSQTHHHNHLHHNNLIDNCCPNQVAQMAMITTHSSYSDTPVPVPPPRRRDTITNHTPKPLKTCIALFDCSKDQDDELQFKKNEIIEILQEQTSDSEWMLGRIGDRQGVFPISFVQMLN